MDKKLTCTDESASVRDRKIRLKVSVTSRVMFKET